MYPLEVALHRRRIGGHCGLFRLSIAALSCRVAGAGNAPGSRSDWRGRPRGAEWMEGVRTVRAEPPRQANEDRDSPVCEDWMDRGKQAMYEVSFGLYKRPFAAAPRVDCCFPAATIEAARQTLTRCIERAEGAGMVVGPSGTGKTLLCQVIAERFRDRLDVVFLSSGRLGNRRALLQGILYGLKRPYREMDEGELRIALIDYLTGPGTPCKGMLLLADEAHTLPLRCLDELRMVTNIAVDGQPRTRLVLFGASLLEE